jgi:hypothetical protein
VHVDRKEKGELVRIGTPFRIKELGDIVASDVAYFHLKPTVVYSRGYSKKPSGLNSGRVYNRDMHNWMKISDLAGVR